MVMAMMNARKKETKKLQHAQTNEHPFSVLATVTWVVYVCVSPQPTCMISQNSV